MTKKIKIATFLIAILGLINELKYLYLSSWSLKPNYLAIILDFFSSINLQFIKHDFYLSDSMGIRFNYLNIAFYILLLLSSTLYYFSKEKETRFLRFLLSIQFLSNIISFIMICVTYYIYKDEFGDRYPVYFLILSLVSKVVFATLSFFILKYFRENSTLDFTVKTYTDESHNMVILTRKWQRFFHLIMDSFCIILLFSFIIEYPIFRELPIFREEYMLYVIIFIVRTIYYLFFESILNATPAKLLTESRVINEKGQKPEFLNIFTRTIFRYIPFEAFSFFGEKGWHDNLSHTYVAKEKRTGVKANTYLWIFPIIIVGSLTYYFGKAAYKDYMFHKMVKQQFETNKKLIENQIKNLSNNSVIQIEPVNYSDEYSNSDLYLKVENVTNNKVTASLLILENDYSQSILKVAEYYNSFKSVVKQVTFDKSELNKTYAKTYDDFNQTIISGANLIGNGSLYKLKEIQGLYEPKLESSGSRNFEADKIVIGIINKGWDATFIDFKNNADTETKWSAEKTEDYYGNATSHYSLIGNNYEYGEDIDVTFKIKDQNNKIHTYKIIGNDEDTHLEKVE